MMEEFYECEFPDEAFDVDAVMKKFFMSREEAQAQVARTSMQRVFRNDLYQVAVAETEFCGESMLHLSIKRIDRDPIHDWRELQEIKNLLVGEENEGFEIYPSESRLVDMANQYHLWVFTNPALRLPIGFDRRMVTGEGHADAVGAKQRPFLKDK